MKIEIKMDGRALALAVSLLLLAGFGYYGWHTLQSGLELRQQTRWIKGLATGADISELSIPPSELRGVAVMAQMARTSGLSESDWQTFETEAQTQLRNGALYIAASILLAGLAIERAFRKSPPKRQAIFAASPDARIDDQQREA